MLFISFKGKHKLLSTEERDRIASERNHYIKEKQAHIQKLEERNKMYEEVEKNFNLDDVISFNYTKNEAKPESMFSWMGL